MKFSVKKIVNNSTNLISKNNIINLILNESNNYFFLLRHVKLLCKNLLGKKVKYY